MVQKETVKKFLDEKQAEMNIFKAKFISDLKALFGGDKIKEYELMMLAIHYPDLDSSVNKAIEEYIDRKEW